MAHKWKHKKRSRFPNRKEENLSAPGLRHRDVETNGESEAELEEKDPEQSQSLPEDNIEIPSWRQITRKRGQQALGPLDYEDRAAYRRVAGSGGSPLVLV